jgi:hypothetical protein
MSEENPHAAVQMLAQTDIYHLRLTGMILKALVMRGVLKDPEVRALIEDVSMQLPDELKGFRQALVQLHDQFPEVPR